MIKKFKHHALNQSCLYKLVGLDKLSEVLLVDIDVIEGLSEIGNELYRDSSIAKKNSDTRRDIENPHPSLKAVQKEFLGF